MFRIVFFRVTLEMRERVMSDLARVVVCLLLGCRLLSLAAGAQASAMPAERLFGDWFVGCDNTRACTALGMIPADAVEIAFVRVQRVAGGESRPQISVLVVDEAAGARRIGVTIDDKPVDGVAALRTAELVPDFGYLQTTLTKDEAPAFVAALRRGRRLQVAVEGGISAQVSLSGATAALLFIDDAQGRVNTVSALIRPGPAEVAAVPPPLPLPIIRPEPAPVGARVDPSHAAALESWARGAAMGCAVDDSSVAAEPEILAPLGGDRILVGVSCGGGAYNFDSVFAVARPGDALQVEPARFTLPAVDGAGPGGAGEGLTNSYFDPQAATLAFFAKGRGIGDCGSSGKYVWTGTAFALAEWRVMPQCRGVSEHFWPLLWNSTDK